MAASCEETPHKVKFLNLKPLRRCFSCGEERNGKHMRLLNNAALQATYVNLVKTTMLVELSPDCDYRLCVSCINFMEKIAAWRKNALKRLTECTLESSKRNINQIGTPSPGFKKKRHVELEVDAVEENVQPIILDHEQTTDHSYVQLNVKESSQECRSSMRNRVLGYRRNLIHQLAGSTQDNQFLDSIKSSRNVNEVASKVMEYVPCRQIIQDELLQQLDNQLLSLSTFGETGSILMMDNSDPKLGRVVELAVDECRARTPLLHALLLTATSEKEEKDFCIFLVYAVLMRCRSQRMNVLQRMLTAACIRHHAGNELLNLLHTFKLTMPESSKLYFLDRLTESSNKDLVPLLAMTNGCKVTVDNIDWHMPANQIRLSSGNHSFHYAHWTIIPDRFSEQDLVHLDNTKPVIPCEPDASQFFCGETDEAVIRSAYTSIIEGILCEEVDGLKMFQNCVKNSNQHKWSHIVDKKSEVYPQEKRSSNLVEFL